ncbi:MAG: hypothetical protein ABIQ04_02040 [Candidatus Saccharimonadales bacterium]
MSTDIETRLTSLESRVAALESARADSTRTGTNLKSAKPQSAKEFLIGLKLGTAVEKTAALGYFVETVSQVGPFNVDDIESAFRSAKEKVPTNIGDMVNKNIKKGLFMEHREKKGGKKSWVLTSTGETLAENDFKELAE